MAGQGEQPGDDVADGVEVDLRDLLNGQTGRIRWPELQRHFARGVLIRVAGDLDLVEAAASVVRDDRVRVESWMRDGRLVNARDEDARRWAREQTEFWAVVAAPWVLVQEVSSRGDAGA